MGNINMIEDGCGIEFTIFINGWKEHFRLCIINRKDYLSDNRQEFAFINDDKTKVVDGVFRAAKRDSEQTHSKILQYGNW